MGDHGRDAMARESCVFRSCSHSGVVRALSGTARASRCEGGGCVEESWGRSTTGLLRRERLCSAARMRARAALVNGMRGRRGAQDGKGGCGIMAGMGRCVVGPIAHSSYARRARKRIIADAESKEWYERMPLGVNERASERMWLLFRLGRSQPGGRCGHRARVHVLSCAIESLARFEICC